ncbi:hypothetical protein TNCV_2968641 [Trichonephila clavipes]|nr:hypothetical protein TNCV_2968641 [Trichonephila clavipes]
MSRIIGIENITDVACPTSLKRFTAVHLKYWNVFDGTGYVLELHACFNIGYRPISKKGKAQKQVANQLAASGKQISRKTVARRLRGVYARGRLSH